ncbi:MAG TPA: response regulator [Candidatus Saccharimonadales bacterium]|nr:response regulator [Candidatus Saccharimonadales bacterium]
MDSENPSPAAAEPSTALPPTGRKVLCVEDEHFISELYTRALTKGGYSVDAVADGAKALEAAKTNNYDIILLDLMIPTVSGIDILRILRDPNRSPPIKARIIIITNLEQREEVRADIENQADGYLVKAELTPHELVEFLDTVK